MAVFLQKNIRYILLTVGAACLVYGALQGDMQAVLTKAAQICLECCGIG